MERGREEEREAYKCSETEGGRLETGRERIWKGEMQTNRKRRAGGLDEPKADRGGAKRVQRDSKINLSYFESEYVVVVVLQIEASGKPSKQLRAVFEYVYGRCVRFLGLNCKSCLKYF